MKLSTLQKGLVFHAPLSEERYNPATKRVDDLTPYENHGTADAANAGVFVADRMGQADRAMSFNGSSDYVDCGNDASLNFGNGVTDTPFSISAWVKMDSSDSFNICSRGTIGAREYSFRTRGNGNLIFDLYDNTSDHRIGRECTTNLIPYEGQWIYVTATYNGSGASTGIDLYFNGNVVDDSDDNNGSYVSMHNDSTNSVIGRFFQDGISYSDGSFADVRIYNRAISPAEITALYEAYRQKLSLGSLMAGLVLDMPLNSRRYNAGNSKFDDLTPYENRGTNSGATVGANHTTFNGTSDNIRIPDSESLSPTSAMTAMCWIKGGGSSNATFLSHYDYGANQIAFKIGLTVASPFNKMRIIITDNGTYQASHRKDYTSNVVVADNTWHLTGFTFDAGTLKLFVDGVEDTNPTKTHDDAITTIYNSTADVMVGCYLNSDTPLGFFNGDITEARLYNRALTAAEWLLAFEKQKGAFL